MKKKLSVAMSMVMLALGWLSPGAGAKVKLVYASWGGAPVQKVYRSLLDEYERLNPGVKVDLLWKTGDYRDVLLTSMAAGVGPDVFLLEMADFRDFATQGLLRDLTSFMRSSKDVSESMFWPTTMISSKYKGALYGLPKEANIVVNYYNKSMYTQAGVALPTFGWADGWTLEQFATACSKLTKDTNGDGKTDQFGASWWYWNYVLQALVHQGGGEVFNDALTKARVAEGSFMDAAQYMHALTFKQKVVGGSWWSGTVANYWSGTWEVAPIKLTIKKFDWDMAPLPRGASPGTTLILCNYSVNARTKHPKEAQQLLKWMATDGNSILARGGEVVPGYKKGLPDYTSSISSKHHSIVEEGEAYAQPPRLVRGFRDVQKMFDEAFAPVWSKGVDPREVVPSLEKRLNAWLQRKQGKL